MAAGGGSAVAPGDGPEAGTPGRAGAGVAAGGRAGTRIREGIPVLVATPGGSRAPAATLDGFPVSVVRVDVPPVPVVVPVDVPPVSVGAPMGFPGPGPGPGPVPGTRAVADIPGSPVPGAPVPVVAAVDIPVAVAEGGPEPPTPVVPEVVAPEVEGVVEGSARCLSRCLPVNPSIRYELQVRTFAEFGA
ncbi:hypothetical protein GCM10022252_34240 [Streptosporangium oxazolinicum]|uniref:Uncharacterized protein n=1 Tax=Streptosporangium oxazolinicum TaxID=909287 RepID=A0ABP8AX25_9ACTN